MVKFISHGDKFHTVQFLKSVSLCQPYCGWHYHLQNLKDGILFMIVGDRCVVRLIDDDVIFNITIISSRRDKVVYDDDDGWVIYLLLIIMW